MKEAASCTFVPPAPDSSVPAPKKGGLFYRCVKRLFDLVFSLVACVLLLIPTLIVCVIIVIDSPGNPIFRQERVGKNGKVIHIWKLRTMVADASTAPEKYFTAEQLEYWKREQKMVLNEEDPRITGVGRILRATSLDEVPQFLNVLVGQLSVIGPRPISMSETYEFGTARDEFLSCKPGITGWWQVTDRNIATWENHNRQLLELFYVRHQSFALDLRIFVRTFKVMFGKNKTGR